MAGLFAKAFSAFVLENRYLGPLALSEDFPGDLGVRHEGLAYPEVALFRYQEDFTEGDRRPGLGFELSPQFLADAGTRRRRSTLA